MTELVTGLTRLAELAERRALTIVGLMSGTSADGVDAAVVRVSGGADGDVEVATLAGGTFPYPDDLRARVLSARDANVEEIACLHAHLGERFAAAAIQVIAAAGLRPGDVDLIGSHGQTIAHLPRGADGTTATLQIGCPARIAERTGLSVVSDFRSRDTAAGGDGAPLVPRVDWLLMRRSDGDRLVQNLGGVGNVTLVTGALSRVRAFDTGPANGPLDAAARLLLATPTDRGGAAAARGNADEGEVARLLADPWFRTPPPRSLARETFGDAIVGRLIARRPELSAEDVLATLTEFVARSVVDAYREHLGVSPDGRGERGTEVRDVVVSGGGVHNDTLMGRLRELLAPLPVRSSADLGVDPDLREAVAFAVLAYLTLRGLPGNVPAVTGARGPRVLGSITVGSDADS